MARKASTRRQRASTPSRVTQLDYRGQHDPVKRFDEQVVDAHGDIGDPFYAESLLQRLERAGDITRLEYAAGLSFQELFHVAQLNELRASDPARVVVSGTSFGDVSGRAEAARNQIADALEAVGGVHSPARLVCWHVLGLGMSLREFEKAEGWEDRRPLSREASKGALVGALGVLEKFFGLS